MIKTLAKCIGKYKKESIITPIFTAVEVFLEILIPFITASIIDKGIQAGDMRKVGIYGGIMLIIAFLSLFCGIQAGKYGAAASTGFACNLREKMYENIQTFSFSNIDKFSTAGLVTRMTTDVTNVQNAYQMIIRSVVRAPLMMICSITMCVIISPRLSIIFLVALIFLGFVLFFIIYKVTPVFTSGFEKYDELNASVQENISGIRVVKAFVREEHENKKFNKAADNLYKTFVKAESFLAFNNPTMMLVVYGCIVALSWFASHFIVSGSITTGNLTSMFSYVMSMLMALMILSMIFVMVSMSAASARRISEVLNEKADLANPEKPYEEVEDGRIDFNHVNFSYRKNSTEDTLHDKGDGLLIAQEISRRMKSELGITVSVGVSFNKIFAKLGSDYKKPDAITTMYKSEFKQKAWSLPVADLLYVGKSTNRKLALFGIKTIGDLARADEDVLNSHLGKMGSILWSFANGYDDSPVKLENTHAPIKSVGNSTTTPKDLVCDEDVKIVLYILAESVAARLRENGFRCRVVEISVRDNELFSFTRQKKIDHATNITGEIAAYAYQIFKENYNWSKPIRSVGVRGADLVTDNYWEQIDLFSSVEKREKQMKMDNAVDEIRRRFGFYSIQRGLMYRDRILSAVNAKEEHTVHPHGYFSG